MAHDTLYTPETSLAPPTPKGGADKCKVCRHPDRTAIDGRILSGHSLASIGREFGVKESSLQAHKARHLAKSPLAATATLRQDIERLTATARTAVNDAESLVDPETRARVLSVANRSLRDALDLAARINGVLSNSATTTAAQRLGMSLDEAQAKLEAMREAEGGKPEDIARQCVEYLRIYNDAHPGHEHYLPPPAPRRERIPKPRAVDATA